MLLLPSESGEEFVYVHYHELNAFESPRAFTPSSAVDRACLLCHATVATLHGDMADVVDNLVHCASCRSYYCHGCLQDYLAHKIEMRQVLPSQLVCPGACQQALPATTLQAHMRRSDFAKYNAFLTLPSPSTEALVCPRPGCGCPLKRLERGRKIHCPACGLTSCYNCGRRFHWWPACRSTFARCWPH